jgi:hypothetical protein
MAAKHIAKGNRFAPMFCNSKNGANPASVLLSHKLEIFATQPFWLLSIRTLRACTEKAWQLSVNHRENGFRILN